MDPLRSMADQQQVLIAQKRRLHIVQEHIGPHVDRVDLSPAA